MGKTFNTGYLQNIIQYDGSNNIILPSLIGTGTRIVVAAANGTLSSQTASTTNIAEGTNLYYTDTRVATYLSTNTYATQSYVTTAIANLVDASPATLDTLNELAAALGDDPNFATTVATSIGTKQAQLNGTGFVKVSGTTVSYDNSTYLTTSSASSTYVPYTGASADLVLGANNFSSKRVSVLKSSDGYGGFTSNYLFLQTGSSTTNVGTDGISLFSKPNQRALSINYDIAGVNYAATLDANLLNASRTFEFPNASGILALTSDIPTVAGVYLPLSGGTLTGDLSIAYTTANLRLFLDNTTATTGRSWYFNSYSNGNLYVGNTTAGDVFNFSSAGVATFSSSVSAAGATFSGTTAVASAAGTSQMRIDRSGTVARIQNYDTGQAANISLAYDGGNVGINNNNPLAKLHVTYSGSDGASVKICGVGGSTNGNFIYSLASDYSDAFPLNVFATNHGSTARVNNLVRIHSNETANGGLPLRVTAQGSIASPTYEAIAVDYLGRVGIGTITPTHNLEIKNSAGSVYQKMNADFGIGYFGMETADDSMRFVTAQVTPIQFYTDNTERMRITAGAGNDLVIGHVGGNPYTAAGRGSIFLNGSSSSLYGWGTGGTARGYMYHNGTNVFLENTSRSR